MGPSDHGYREEGRRRREERALARPGSGESFGGVSIGFGIPDNGVFDLSAMVGLLFVMPIEPVGGGELGEYGVIEAG